MNEHRADPTDLERRYVMQGAGLAVAGGLLASSITTASAATDVRSTSAAARNAGSLGARLQGVQHFGLTVQNMDRAFAFYTEVLGGTEVMRDGDFQGERIHNTLLTDQEIEALSVSTYASSNSTTSCSNCCSTVMPSSPPAAAPRSPSRSIT
jgi:hypothetical protein